MPDSVLLRLGTRGSLLARTQSQQVADALMAATPGVRVELVILKTTGDQVQDRPLAALGGKGLFTKELEQALLDGRVDFAVHSYKDVPVTMPLVDVSALEIIAVPPREDARDVLIGREPGMTIDRLPPSAKVGTGSLRRACQLLERRPDLQILGLRGNIDTRLRKLADGEYDAIVLAAAGLKRAGFFHAAAMTPLDAEQFVPSPGQGALAIQCRRSDVPTVGFLRPLHDVKTAECVNLERQIVLGLNGDCHSPIGAHAVQTAGEVTLRLAVGADGGGLPVRRSTVRGPISQADPLVRAAIAALA
ncbi:MAG: hemC [Phycisphaerales bacterium]|nr:hemC [Phycisphaerales bacterium]